MATRDPVALALASIGAGATSGAAAATLGLLLLRTLGSPERLGSMAGALLTASVAVGAGVALATGWSLSKALEESWRRGVIGVLSIFGATLLTTLAMPADMIGRIGGLAAYAVVLLVAAGATRRAAARSANQ